MARKKMHRRLPEKYMDYEIDRHGDKVFILPMKYDSYGNAIEMAMCGRYTDPGYQTNRLVKTHDNCLRCSKYS